MAYNAEIAKLKVTLEAEAKSYLKTLEEVRTNTTQTFKEITGQVAITSKMVKDFTKTFIGGMKEILDAEKNFSKKLEAGALGKLGKSLQQPTRDLSGLAQQLTRTSKSIDPKFDKEMRKFLETSQKAAEAPAKLKPIDPKFDKQMREMLDAAKPTIKGTGKLRDMFGKDMFPDMKKTMQDAMVKPTIQGLDKLRNATSKTMFPDAEKHVKDSFEKAFQSVMPSAQQFSDFMTEKLTAPLRAFAEESVQAFSDFNQKLIASTSITQAGTEEIKAMGDEAIRLSLEGPQSAAKLAEAYFFLASAGLDVQQSMEALPAIQRFATAGAFDLAQATTLAADAQQALGLAAENAVQHKKNLIRITDVLIRADQIANATTRQFAIALTRVGGTARIYHKSVEETTAALAVYAKLGIKAELAGNTLDRMFRLLNKAVQKHSDAHQQLGFHVFDSEGKMRSLADIVQNLEKILDPVSDKMRAARLAALGFEARMQHAILPLIGHSKLLREWTKTLEHAGGATKNVADKQMKSFENQMKLVGNEITALKIKIGEILGPAVLFFANVIKHASEQLREMHPLVQALVIGFLAGIAVVGPLTGLIILLAAGWAKLIVVMKAYQASAILVGASTAKWTILLGIAQGLVIALKVAIVALGVAILAGIFHWVSGFAALNAELKKSVELGEELSKMKLDRFTKELETINAVTDPAKRQAQLGAMAKRIQTEMTGITGKTGLAEEIAKTRKEVERLEDLKKRGGMRVSIAATADLKIESQRLKELEASYKALKEQLKTVQDEMKKTAQVQRNLAEETPQLIKDLQEALALFGFKGAQRDVEKARLKGELDAEDLAVAKALANQLDAAEKTRELNEDIDKLIQSLRVEAQTFRMTGEEAKVFELKMKGLNGEKAKQLDALTALRKAQEEWKKAQEDGKKVTEEMRTPLEVFNDRIAELKKLFAAGGISPQTFVRAVIKAREEFNKVGDSAKKAKEEVQKFDAALFGSAEAISRIAAYDAMIAAERATALPAAQGAGGGLIPAPAPGKPVDNRPPEERAENQEIVKTLKEMLKVMIKNGAPQPPPVANF